MCCYWSSQNFEIKTQDGERHGDNKQANHPNKLLPFLWHKEHKHNVCTVGHSECHRNHKMVSSHTHALKDSKVADTNPIHRVIVNYTLCQSEIACYSEFEYKNLRFNQCFLKNVGEGCWCRVGNLKEQVWITMDDDNEDSLHDHMLNPKTLPNTVVTSNSHVMNPMVGISQKYKSFVVMDVK